MVKTYIVMAYDAAAVNLGTGVGKVDAVVAIGAHQVSNKPALHVVPVGIVEHPCQLFWVSLWRCVVKSETENSKVCILLFSSANGIAASIRLKIIVRVDKHHVVAMSLLNTHVTSSRHTRIGFANMVESAVAASRCLKERTDVGECGAVVDEQKLHVVAFLLQHTVYTVLQEDGVSVVHRYNDR